MGKVASVLRRSVEVAAQSRRIKFTPFDFFAVLMVSGDTEYSGEMSS